MRSISLVILVIVSLSCNEDELAPIVKELIGTTWRIEKIEIYDQNNNLFRTVEPPQTCHSIALSFRNTKYLVHGSACQSRSEGCGEWNVSNNKISFNILSGQSVVGLCAKSNFTSQIVANGENIVLRNERLIIDGWNTTLYQLNLQPDFIDLQNDSFNHEITIRTHFIQIYLDLPNDLTCCGKL